MEGCGIPAFLRLGATACVAWDGAAGIMLVSVDGAPYVAPFPPDIPVRPSATAGAGLYPAIWGNKGSVVEWSMSGGLGLVPPSADYVPYDTLNVRLPLPPPPPPTHPPTHPTHRTHRRFSRAHTAR